MARFKEYQFVSGAKIFDFADKEKAIDTHVRYMLNKALPMIRHDNLPDTMPQRDISLLLMRNGYICIPDPEKYFKGKMYAFFGGLGGEYNEYYRPTHCIVSNPYLKFDEDMEIGKDCLIVPHDSMYMGLLPIFNKYGTMLVENELSLLMADYNSRMQAILSANDDRTQKSAKTYLDGIIKGKLGVIGSTSLRDDILKAHQFGTSQNNSITQLIEMEQYLKAGEFNEIGLNANYNMKREAINTSEAELNWQSLYPFIDDIIETQTRAFDEVNKRYGTNIKPVLNSSWFKAREVQEEQEQEQTEPEQEKETEVKDNGENN